MSRLRWWIFDVEGDMERSLCEVEDLHSGKDEELDIRVGTGCCGAEVERNPLLV